MIEPVVVHDLKDGSTSPHSQSPRHLEELSALMAPFGVVLDALRSAPTPDLTDRVMAMISPIPERPLVSAGLSPADLSG